MCSKRRKNHGCGQKKPKRLVCNESSLQVPKKKKKIQSHLALIKLHLHNCLQYWQHVSTEFHVKNLPVKKNKEEKRCCINACSR